MQAVDMAGAWEKRDLGCGEEGNSLACNRFCPHLQYCHAEALLGLKRWRIVLLWKVGVQGGLATGGYGREARRPLHQGQMRMEQLRSSSPGELPTSPLPYHHPPPASTEHLLYTWPPGAVYPAMMWEQKPNGKPKVTQVAKLGSDIQGVSPLCSPSTCHCVFP